MSAALRKKPTGDDDEAPKAATPPPIPKAKPKTAAPSGSEQTAPVAKAAKPGKAKKEKAPKKAKEPKKPKAKEEKAPKEKGGNKKTVALLLVVLVLGGVVAFINLSGADMDKDAAVDEASEATEAQVETQQEPEEEEVASVNEDVPLVERRVKSGQSSWILSKRRLDVTATMRGGDGQMLAVVNGEMLKVGDIAKAEYEGTTFYWRLSEIEYDGAEWKPVKSTKMLPAE